MRGKRSQGVGGGEKKGKMTLRKWEAKENNKVTRNKEGMQIDFFLQQWEHGGRSLNSSPKSLY